MKPLNTPEIEPWPSIQPDDVPTLLPAYLETNREGVVVLSVPLASHDPIPDRVRIDGRLYVPAENGEQP